MNQLSGLVLLVILLVWVNIAQASSDEPTNASLSTEAIEETQRTMIVPLTRELKILEGVIKFASIDLRLYEHFVSLSWSRVHRIHDNRINEPRSCFVPLGDLFNYSKKQANVISFTEQKTNELVYKISRRVKKGDELFVTYGQVTPTLNHLLMLDYGFCHLDLSDKEFLNNTITSLDFRETVMKMMEDKSLNQYRVNILSATSLDSYHLVQILPDLTNRNLEQASLSEIFDPNMVSILRILASTEEELKPLIGILSSMAPKDEKRKLFAKLLINPISDKNEQLVMSLIMDLIDKQIPLRAVSEDDLRKANTPTLKCIVRYKQAELKILQDYRNLFTVEQSETTKDEL